MPQPKLPVPPPGIRKPPFRLNPYGPAHHPRHVALAFGVIAVGGALWLSRDDRTVHAEPIGPLDEVLPLADEIKGKGKARLPKLEPKHPDDLNSFAWGHNGTGVAAPSTSTSFATIKTPRLVPAFSGPGIALRDVHLGQNFGAVVDARGDVYMWGEDITDVETGDSPAEGLKKCLVDLDIVEITASKRKLFALSSKGRVYALPTTTALQAPTAPRSVWSYFDPLHVLTSRPQPVDYTVLDVRTLRSLSLNWGEVITSIKAGQDHLLALSSLGRVFGHAISESANSHCQLGNLELIVLPRPTTHRLKFETGKRHSLVTLAIPDFIRNGRIKMAPGTDPWILQSLPPLPEGETYAYHDPAMPTVKAVKTARGLRPEEDIHWSTTLYEIPVLEGVRVDQIAAGLRASYVRMGGRVLGFGANEYGQIGLGAGLSADNVHSPTEIILAKSQGYNGAHTIQCEDITASGNTCFFTVRRTSLDDPAEYIDLLSSGHGTFGALGNGTWWQISPGCVKVKSISGLSEYSEDENRIVPLGIHKVVVSPTENVMAVLDTSPLAQKDGSFVYGRDLLVWGANDTSQLGNGKRNNLPAPQHLPPLPFTPLLENVAKEARVHSGTASHMPHSRLQLNEAYVQLRDLQGRKVGWSKHKVEQSVVAGHGTGAVFWKVV